MLNHYPRWKNILLFAVVILALVYAAPNLYGEDYAIQISALGSTKLDNKVLAHVEDTLKEDAIAYQDAQLDNQSILVRFKSADKQLQAKDRLQAALGENFTVALNLAESTPAWLRAIGATPMKLGLDLRGGINFLLDVDVQSVVAQRSQGMAHNVKTELEEADIHSFNVTQQKDNTVLIALKDTETSNVAQKLVEKRFPDFQITKLADGHQLQAQLREQALNEIQRSTIEQTMTTLRHRVNELGIAEAVVQQQGLNRISVEMPGIQDTARAQEILGGTATLEFRFVDQEHASQLVKGTAPAGDTLYTYEGRPYFLKNQVILTGNSITDAAAAFGEDGHAAVDITLGGSGGGETQFHRITGQNIGRLLAIVYVDSRVETKTIKGKVQKTRRKVERVISIAAIRSALPSKFQITGLSDPQEARNLSLLLRAGALPANIDVVEERVLGPQLGAENIKKGILSVEVGLVLIIIFMAFYYRLFGLIADAALLINLVLLVAVLSLLGMTLTLPGIAGIVLIVGMAVDANVLIFERIREELRNGVSPQASIHAGYERAFATIVDANITTLIVALVLFGIGTGPVKGFAVTLSLGIFTSMLSGIAMTRAGVNAMYGGRSVKQLSIGI